jgi:diaminohydroxyphosphoribosylaminopyrimidine deaminase/5-amino-6-(5-phosphoribosylamino)uracil reductase
MQVEEKYMMRCLDLAQSGRSSVAPNPMVGAVIVHKGQIIGEGYHRQYGGAHAEVNAIRYVQDETLLPDSTLYVNLEPCAHQGKTSPCTELIIRKQIPRVVVGCLDPFPKVAGRGVKQLCDAGIKVVTDVMKKEAVFLNRYFMTAHTKQRPYVILKWAQSRDGYIDRIRKDVSEKPVRLSNPASCRYVHRLRSEVSAIMIGTNTARLDNPSLTVRHWVGKSPVRVFLDRTLRIPQSYRLFDGAAPVLVFTEMEGGNWGSRGNWENRDLPLSEGNNSQFSPESSSGFNCFRSESQTFIFNTIVKSQFKNAEYIPIDFSGEVIPQVLHSLYERKIYSLLVEGGACLHERFLDSGLWDELQIETTPVKLISGVKIPVCNLSKIAEFHKNIYCPSEDSDKGNQSIVSVYFCK